MKSFLSIELAIGVIVAFALVFTTVGAIGKLSHETGLALCLNNLRNLGQAVTAYAEDHSGELPVAVNRTKRPWKWWYHAIFPYVTDVRSFYCPLKAPKVFDEATTSPLLPAVWNINDLSYGLNSNIDVEQRSGNAIRMHDIADPDHTVMLCESSAYLIHTARTAWEKEIAPRHEQSASVVYFSGRTESCPVPPLAIPKKNGEGILDLASWSIN